MKINALFAKVVIFRPNHSEPEKGFGFADTAGGQRFYIPMWACRKIVAGLEGPEFSPEEWNQWPKGAEFAGNNLADEVVLIPDLRPPRSGEAPRAYRWGYRRWWDVAAREIEARPIYRVMGENRFRGQVVPAERREEEVAVGTMEELQAKFPREMGNDPLRADKPYHSGPCQRINRWFVWKDGDWCLCEDPRPSSILTMDCQQPNGCGELAMDLAQEFDKMGQVRVAKFNARYQRQPVAA